MNLAIFYDTETTGLPDFKAPSEAVHQPHIVQLAFALVDLDTRRILEISSQIVKPDGYEIPQEIASVHGITNEMAVSVGHSEVDVLLRFCKIAINEKILVGAHNASFDARIIRIAIKRYLGDSSEILEENWKNQKTFCTMQAAKKVMKLPPTEKMIAAGFGNQYKNPNLSETYKFFTGKKLVGAHDAMNDLLATIDIYFAIKELEL